MELPSVAESVCLLAGLLVVAVNCLLMLRQPPPTRGTLAALALATPFFAFGTGTKAVINVNTGEFQIGKAAIQTHFAAYDKFMREKEKLIAEAGKVRVQYATPMVFSYKSGLGAEPVTGVDIPGFGQVSISGNDANDTDEVKLYSGGSTSWGIGIDSYSATLGPTAFFVTYTSAGLPYGILPGGQIIRIANSSKGTEAQDGEDDPFVVNVGTKFQF